jgi:hypothetical protein
MHVHSCHLIEKSFFEQFLVGVAIARGPKAVSNVRFSPGWTCNGFVGRTSALMRIHMNVFSAKWKRSRLAKTTPLVGIKL